MTSQGVNYFLGDNVYANECAGYPEHSWWNARPFSRRQSFFSNRAHLWFNISLQLHIKSSFYPVQYVSIKCVFNVFWSFYLWIESLLHQIRQLQHSQQNSWLSYWWWRALFETFFATGDLRNDIVKIRSRRLVLCLKKWLELWVTFGVILCVLLLCTYCFWSVELILNFDDVLINLKVNSNMNL